MAGGRHRWPRANVIAADGWETSPDPRHDRFYCVDDGQAGENDEDDGEDDRYELACDEGACRILSQSARRGRSPVVGWWLVVR